MLAKIVQVNTCLFYRKRLRNSYEQCTRHFGKNISLEGILMAFNLSIKLHQSDRKKHVLTPHKIFDSVVLLSFLSQVLLVFFNCS